jgi:hypothetical protein
MIMAKKNTSSNTANETPAAVSPVPTENWNPQGRMWDGTPGNFDDKPHPYKIGSKVFIRTVTMYNTGEVFAVFPDTIVLAKAAWVAHAGRWANALKDGESALVEVEPFPDGTLTTVNRQAIIDVADWIHDLPRTQK